LNVTLGSEFEKRINEKVACGLYTSASEVIRDGLRLLFEKDVTKQQQGTPKGKITPAAPIRKAD